ncbi:uncharacterized protein LOC112592920 [Melanaphis sacchari]|uniref:uncharacterized protein LOC112592920 n=1 Tax=Melanaphis sacchari TaxID=742174 RepID=UPI000DC147D2|nr:uncharacterized protein LOC112592920 [Melanaphis sacchari]
MFAAYVSKNPTFIGSELEYYKMVAEAAESIVNENEELKQDSLKDMNIEPVIKNSIILINKMVSDKMNQIENQVCAKFENIKLGQSSTANKPKVQEHRVEWWCPVNSTFEEIIKTIKPETEDDIKIIRRAKARNWKKGGQIRCCTNDRLKTNTTLYVLPSCWPKENVELITECL